MDTIQHSTNGFNYDLGQTWIYPTNFPVRKYQKEIVREALFQNTMVCLPTGLGKTFIAAVVMYNYYRWFPFDKVIFMATTRPLVNQQIDACYKIVRFPKNVTAELTGTVLKQNRQHIWATKRVFFLTPQLLLNDLDAIAELGNKIKCIVIDEAHRARGNHAYCEVMRKLTAIHSNFRVVALTASPASSIRDLVDMCNTLLISHIEVRCETSPDVIPFVHARQLETIVIELSGKLEEIVQKYKVILDKYLRILHDHNVLRCNFHSLHKGRLFYLSKQYDEKNTHNRSTTEYKLIKKVFGTCTILLHAQDLLERHGMRSFLTFYQENIEKPLLHGCADEIRALMTEIAEHVGPELISDKLPNGAVLPLPPNCLFGHPKFYKLRDILRAHFSTHDANSKVIVFCEYKESVAEANAMLIQEERIKPKMFMGQSSISQRQQLQIIESFHKGISNTLISTCIAEEGIDVGFVDLVICFDVSNKSSLRLIQRIGRTGRTRRGRVVFLVTRGREEQLLTQSLQEKKYVTSSLLKFKGLQDKLYQNSPRMVPSDVTPECNEIFIAAEETQTSKKSLMESWCHTSREDCSLVLTPITDFIPGTEFVSLQGRSQHLDVGQLDFGKNPDYQRSLYNMELNSVVGTSSNSTIFVDLLKMVEYKRFNLHVGKSSSNSTRSKMKQTDIRSIFKQQSILLSQKMEIDLVEDELDPDYELHIASTLNSSTQACQICEHFQLDIPLKTNLIQIPFFNKHLNLSVINKHTLTNYLQTRGPEMNEHNNSFREVIDDDYINLMPEIHSSEVDNANFHEFSNLAAVFNEPMQLTRKENVDNDSDDMFDDDDDHLVPEQVQETSDSINAKRKSLFANEDVMNPAKKQKLTMCDVFQETLFISEEKNEPNKAVEKLAAPVQSLSLCDIFEGSLFEPQFENQVQNEAFFTPNNQELTAKTASNKNTNISPFIESVDRNIEINELKIDDVFNWALCGDVKELEKPKTLETELIPIPNIDADIISSGEESPILSNWCSTSRKSRNEAISPEKQECQSQYSPVIRVPKKTNRQFNNLDTTELSEHNKTITVSNANKLTLNKLPKCKKSANNQSKHNARMFLVSQVEISSDEHVSSDEMIDNNDEDAYDTSFVDDEEIDKTNFTQMKAVYLQSVRSPVKKKLLRSRQQRHVQDTFVDHCNDETYARDSFCVDSDVEIQSTQTSVVSELEKAEKLIEQRRKLRKKKKKRGRSQISNDISDSSG